MSEAQASGDGPPDRVCRALGLPQDVPSMPLPGGRINRVWRVDTADGPRTLKLYGTRPSPPLFPNRWEDEVRALRALARTGLGPEVVAVAEGALLTEYCAGARWSGAVEAPVRALRRLHRQSPPAGLRRRPMHVLEVLAEGDAISRGLAEPHTLLDLRPDVPDRALGPAVFLHGDPVPGNILIVPGGVRLIDWQCPGLGPAVEDLALFLSPAMQVTNGTMPLSPNRVAQALAAYGDAEVAETYRVAAPAYHWRMLAHCQWWIERGAAGFDTAWALERAALARAVTSFTG